jgi:hypothetical protein
MKRPTILHFINDTLLNFLDEKVFLPFFESNIGNKITMESGSSQLERNNFLSYLLIKESKIVRMVMTLEVAVISKIAENRELFLFYKIIIIQKPCIIEERMTHYFKGVQMSFKMTCHLT